MPTVTEKTIKLDKDAIKSLDISHLAEQSLNKNDWLTAGQSEYRLYAWLSTQFNNTTILDVGTRTGGSALALSYNDKNKVAFYMLLTIIGGAVFVGSQAWEWKNFIKGEYGAVEIPVSYTHLRAHET